MCYEEKLGLRYRLIGKQKSTIENKNNFKINKENNTSSKIALKWNKIRRYGWKWFKWKWIGWDRFNRISQIKFKAVLEKYNENTRKFRLASLKEKNIKRKFK
jgi:hypothetical protein